jgi:5'-nucleotidase / UDP-sugar diphosphatase
MQMRKGRNIFTSILLTLMIAGVACAANPESTSSPSSGLTFVHLNDTYRVGAVEDGTKGGFGRVTTVVRTLLAEGRDVRILHAGDFLYPSLESELWNGLQMVDALNYLDSLAPLYAVIGNHELDRHTPEFLIAAVRASHFDWLGDNYRFVTGDAAVDSALHDAFTFDHHGRTIGIFALTLHADEGGNERDYAPVERDFLAAAERSIEKLEAAGADAIIGLTHLHLWQDREVAKLRLEHPAFILIAGGHEHQPQFSPLSAESAAIVKGASNARVIWTIDLDFDMQSRPVIDAHLRDMDESVAADTDYARLDAKWRARLLDKFPFLTARVGRAAVAMDATEETIRNAENGWGNFIVDQMRTAFGEPAADFAFINSGTLRIDDYVSGDILFEDIGRTFGFSSYLRIMNMSGAEFRGVMEAGYRGRGASQGYFPQLSGFRVCVDRSRASGERIVSLQVPAADGWSEIDTGTMYSVVVPDFLYRGGDGYQLPQDRPVSRPGSELKYLVLDAILRAQAEGRAVGALPDPANPRFVELGAERSDCWH